MQSYEIKSFGGRLQTNVFHRHQRGELQTNVFHSPLELATDSFLPLFLFLLLDGLLFFSREAGLLGGVVLCVHR